MKIKINETGNLLIERAGIYKEQYCVFFNSRVDTCPNSNSKFKYLGNCGDYCPLFGEAEGTSDGRVISFRICKAEFYLKKDNFIDERVKGEK